MGSKVIELEDIPRLRQECGEIKVVHCHGVFDLLHIGHIDYLRSAKKNGDLLFVSLTGDKFVNKGPGRPYFNEYQRARMLEAQEIVDYVVINYASTAVNIINILKPDFYIKGPDYKGDQDISGNILKEKEAVEKNGGVLFYTSDNTESSTSIINKYFRKFSYEEKNAINNIKKNYRLSKVINIINSLSDIRVLVIGEPIIDSYIFCKPENLSSKSASISANYINEEHYPGGTWAVARHLSALGCKVQLLAPTGGDELGSSIENLVATDKSIFVQQYAQNHLITHQKIRYISESTSQRMFELTKLETLDWSNANLEEFESRVLSLSEQSDLVLILDFGHGLWEGDRLNVLRKINKFKALNVQTNSGNFGYNFFHKHKDYDYLSIDERELRLALHDRFSDIEDVAFRAFNSYIQKEFSVTLGKNGSAHIKKGGSFVRTPIFFSDPIDTTGAGDAFFSVASLLRFKGINGDLITFVGNIYAGLKTKIMGNKTAVSRIELIKSIESILK